MRAAAVGLPSHPSGAVPENVNLDGGSTQAERLFALAYDDTADELTDFPCRMPSSYAGGGLTVKIHIGRETGTAAADIRLGIAVRRLNTSEDRDTSHTYDFNEATVAMPTSVGTTVEATITFTDGADMDSLAAGEEFLLRARREPTQTAEDDLTDDAYYYLMPSISVYETGT